MDSKYIRKGLPAPLRGMMRIQNINVLDSIETRRDDIRVCSVICWTCRIHNDCTLQGVRQHIEYCPNNKIFATLPKLTA